MNPKTPITDEGAAREEMTRPKPERRLPAPVERAGFELQERLLWPLQDRFSLLGPGTTRILFGAGALALAAIAVVAVIALSGGGGSSAPVTTAADVATPRQPLVAPEPTSEEAPQEQAPVETLHGAKPVFSSPSSAIKGGEKTGGSDAGEKDESATDTSSPSSSASDSPDAATIASDPKKNLSDGDASATATAAQAPAADGPPAGPAALKVARKFAQGFVVYETGGSATKFEPAFGASATPQLAKALLDRPPKQPAGVEVPRAKVLNVVAGPSQGRVYKVSVSLLRVGVTSELRLDMENLGSQQRPKWRVTNVLG